MFPKGKMFFPVALVLIFCKLSVSQESSCESNANYTTCSIFDAQCQTQFFRNLRDTSGQTGSPGLGLPSFEPFVLTNASFKMLGLNITLVKGETIGITKTCDAIEYKLDLETYKQTFELLCTNITIVGHYTITSDETADEFFGAEINGDGYVNMVSEDWYYKIVTPFEFVRNDDGAIYLNVRFTESDYVSKILTKVDLCIDGITLDNKDISKFVSKFFTDNWELINTPAADPFHEKSMDYFFQTYNTFFTNVPAEEYFCDDLSQYVN